MSGFSAIDLSQLPAPNVVEPLDFEAILAARKKKLIELKPDLKETLELESEPLVKFLEEVALREVLLRKRVNEASQAVMLPYATGADLDNLAAFYGIERDVLDIGDPKAVPPIPPTYESDVRLRERIQLSLEGFSTAGPAGAYIFHAKSADARVKDVSVTNPTPGAVAITILSTLGNGAPVDDKGKPTEEMQDILLNVSTVLDDEDVRPLTDKVSVQAAEIISYSITVTLYFEAGPGSDEVLIEAKEALQNYVDKHHRLGQKITTSGLHAALHQTGVAELALVVEPEDIADVDKNSKQAVFCKGFTVNDGGVKQ